MGQRSQCLGALLQGAARQVLLPTLLCIERVAKVVCQVTMNCLIRGGQLGTRAEGCAESDAVRWPGLYVKTGILVIRQNGEVPTVCYWGHFLRWEVYLSSTLPVLHFGLKGRQRVQQVENCHRDMIVAKSVARARKWGFHPELAEV